MVGSSQCSVRIEVLDRFDYIVLKLGVFSDHMSGILDPTKSNDLSQKGLLKDYQINSDIYHKTGQHFFKK